jgi:hypothetical protein
LIAGRVKQAGVISPRNAVHIRRQVESVLDGVCTSLDEAGRDLSRQVALPVLLSLPRAAKSILR